MGDAVTEFGNIVFVLSAVFGMYYALSWHKTGLTNGSATLIKAWVCIITAVFVRIGWWVLALRLANEGQTYHPMFVEWKWIVSVPTAILFTYGVILFVDSIDRLKPKDKYISFTACMILAALIAII